MLVSKHHSPKKQGLLGERVDSRIGAQRVVPNEPGTFPDARKKENAQKIYNSFNRTEEAIERDSQMAHVGQFEK